MVELVPGINIERFELNVYEDPSSKTNTNDTVIYRDVADDEVGKEGILVNATKKYKGFKYKLTDYGHKKPKSKIGIL